MLGGAHLHAGHCRLVEAAHALAAASTQPGPGCARVRACDACMQLPCTGLLRGNYSFMLTSLHITHAHAHSQPSQSQVPRCPSSQSISSIYAPLPSTLALYVTAHPTSPVNSRATPLHSRLCSRENALCSKLLQRPSSGSSLLLVLRHDQGVNLGHIHDCPHKPTLEYSREGHDVRQPFIPWRPPEVDAQRHDHLDQEEH